MSKFWEQEMPVELQELYLKTYEFHLYVQNNWLKKNAYFIDYFIILQEITLTCPTGIS